MKRIRTIAVLLVPMLVLGAFVLALSGLLPYKIYAVQTGSMSPTIPPTSAVIVKPGVYRIGQPISFHEDGGIITHRLMAIHSDGTIDTKGDANATIDPWHVSTKAIIGEVVASQPHLGYWLVFLRNPIGLLSILLAAVLCWQIWSISGPGKTAAENSSPENNSPENNGRGKTEGRKSQQRVRPRMMRRRAQSKQTA
jgi:signal peptidase